jgi:triosephosphate isomerase
MRLVAGNWKMNGSPQMADALVRDLARRLTGTPPAQVLLCPPFTLLERVVRAAAGTVLQVGAQDCSTEGGPGAFTGEISAAMLAEAGCRAVIVGHSERRQRHGETDAQVRAKATQALAAGLLPLICVGESRAEREDGRAETVVAGQLQGSLPPLSPGQQAVIAYEPVWAIGTGLTATPEDVRAMHARIRRELRALGGPAGEAAILYGGSVKAGNAAELFAVPEVAGALVGGASLEAEGFAAIVEACR